MCASAWACGLNIRMTIGSTIELHRLLALHLTRYRDAVIARPGGVGSGARVAERERSDSFRRQPPQREGQVPAHGQPHNRDALDVQ